MNKEDIIRMAREAGGFLGELPMADAWLFLEEEQLERFADLVVAAERERIIAANAPEIEAINAHIKVLEDAVDAEREACAKLADDFAKQILEHNFSALIANNIRARGEKL